MKNLALFRSTLVALAALLHSVSVWPCSVEEPSLGLFVADLRYKVSGPFGVDELERQNMIEIRENGGVLPFGYANEPWEKLKRQMKPGDAFYFIVQREPSFYMDGHALVRDGCVIGFLRGKIS